MSILEQVLIAIALAVDCFSVSISCGILQRKMGSQVLVMAPLFGFFQGLMTLLGWLLAGTSAVYIAAFDHWVAFALLAFLGGRMLISGFRKEKTETFNPSSITTILLLSVATSIDAAAVGYSFPTMGVIEWSDLMIPISLIGAASFLMSIMGKYIGVTIGHHSRMPAEPLGGIILIAIGVKVLLTHMTSNP